MPARGGEVGVMGITLEKAAAGREAKGPLGLFLRE